MTRLISFGITSAFAAFADPSIRTNSAVYYIPSKTSVVGILGSLVGKRRDKNGSELYSEEYREFFSKIKIGLKLENNPRKITYYTNYRSMKKSETKPTKKEILEKPKYRIYVKSTDEILDQLYNTIKNHTYYFSPYLGHAYCPAQLTDLIDHNNGVEKIDNPEDEKTDCVVLDETETYNENFKIHLEQLTNDSTLIIERHLHHFCNDSNITKRVLKHWIPLESKAFEIETLKENELSEFYKIGEMVYCLY